jgi:hypothetical protein
MGLPGGRARRIYLVPPVLFALLLSPTPASAGGSWLEVVEVSDGALSPPDGGSAWAAVGATVRMRGSFCSGQQANPSEGPWFASLRSADGGTRTPLGPVDIATGENDACPWVAAVSFVVPQVPGGSYWVDVCDAGCTTGVGDLTGGYFVVAASGVEAKLLQRLTTLRLGYEHMRQNSEIYRHRIDGLEVRLNDARHEARRQQLDLDAATASQEQATADLQRAAEATDHERAVSQRWRLAAIATTLTLVLTVTKLLMASRRSRRLPRVELALPAPVRSGPVTSPGSPSTVNRSG